MAVLRVLNFVPYQNECSNVRKFISAAIAIRIAKFLRTRTLAACCDAGISRAFARA